jgi:hypothetical protein
MATRKKHDSDLKSREYRDAKGHLHHHTESYMEQHRSGSGERRASGETRTVRVRAAGSRRPARSAASARSAHTAHPLIDHDEIRRWAESRGAHPACVKGTGRKGDVGMIRLDFPGFTGRESLQPISWNEWFKAFDQSKLALLVQERTARGQESNFNKLVSRTGAAGRSRARSKTH